ADHLWRKLLDEGVSPNKEIRRAAHLASLQAVLTDPAASRTSTDSWSLAAKTSTAPGLRVAETGIATQRESSER
ncbi:MAG: hypothetical protein ACR2Q3_07915, partial [Woeseiaceae bacterium]